MFITHVGARDEHLARWLPQQPSTLLFETVSLTVSVGISITVLKHHDQNNVVKNE